MVVARLAHRANPSFSATSTSSSAKFSEGVNSIGVIICGSVSAISLPLEMMMSRAMSVVTTSSGTAVVRMVDHGICFFIRHSSYLRRSSL